MKILMQSVLLFFFGSISFISCMNNPAQTAVGVLQQQILNSYSIRQHIPGNPNLISDDFKIFLAPFLISLNHYNIEILTNDGTSHSKIENDYIRSFHDTTQASSAVCSQNINTRNPGSEITTFEDELTEQFLVRELLEHPNLNQIELLQAFELAIRERSKIYQKNNENDIVIYQTFLTFPQSVQRKLRPHIVLLEDSVANQSSSSSSSTQNSYEKLS